MRVYLNTDVIILMMYHNQISAREIARKEGANVIHLGQILRRGICNYQTAVKIADALGLPVDQVILKRMGKKVGYHRARWATIDPEKVVKIMNRKGISESVLCDRYGCTRQNIWYLLNPLRSRVRLETAKTLAGALEVGVEEVIKEGTE